MVEISQVDQDKYLAAFHILAATQDATQNVFAGPAWLARARIDKLSFPRVNKDAPENYMPMRFLDAALSEAGSELWTCACPIAWWKKTVSVDLKNAKVELVDIMHFLLCEDILRAMPRSTLEPIPEQREFAHASAAKAMLHGLRSAHYWQQNRLRMAQELADDPTANTKVSPLLTLRSSVREFMQALLSDGLQTSMIWTHYWNVALLVHEMQGEGGSAADSLAGMYIAKAALNRVRQEKGDKQGKYARKWDGREDNEHVMEQLTKHLSSGQPMPTVEQLQGWINAKYLELMHSNKLEIVHSH